MSFFITAIVQLYQHLFNCQDDTNQATRNTVPNSSISRRNNRRPRVAIIDTVAIVLTRAVTSHVLISFYEHARSQKGTASWRDLQSSLLLMPSCKLGQKPKITKPTRYSIYVRATRGRQELSLDWDLSLLQRTRLYSAFLSSIDS
jgi:hypothetical protein